MSGRFFTLLTLACLLWQSLSGLSPFAFVKQANEISHAIVHSQNANHHHHDDHSLHLDEPGRPAAHHHHDGASSVTGMPPTPSTFATTTQGSLPGLAQFLAHPPPYLEGPLRPPQSLA